MTLPSGRPLARAVVTKSLRMVSSTAERVCRAFMAMPEMEFAMIGMIQCFQLPMPNGGSHPSLTEKSTTIISANQNCGTEMNTMAKTSRPWSCRVLRWIAAETPSGMPMTVWIKTEIRPSVSVRGSLSIKPWETGTLY